MFKNACSTCSTIILVFLGPLFTWKEDDASARFILEGSFGLHAKTRFLGSTFHLVYMLDCPSTFVFGSDAKIRNARSDRPH